MVEEYLRSSVRSAASSRATAWLTVRHNPRLAKSAYSFLYLSAQREEWDPERSNRDVSPLDVMPRRGRSLRKLLAAISRIFTCNKFLTHVNSPHLASAPCNYATAATEMQIFLGNFLLTGNLGYKI